jgi:predicted Zn-dependent protease
MASRLASESTFRRVAETVLSASTADDTFVSFSDSEDSTLRFANNQVVQNVSVRSPSVRVSAAFGLKVGSARTNRLDTDSLKEAVRQAERIARVVPDDPEHLPSLDPQRYVEVPTYRESTASTTPADLAKRTKPVIDRCMQYDLAGAGIMRNRVSVKGVAASSGLFGFEGATEARFSLTATAEDSSGWTLNAHRDINALDVRERTDRAVDKALRSKEPREIEPGHYPVILEPAAVAGIFGPFFWFAGAKSYYKGNSPFVGRLGSVVLDHRLTIRTDPTHKDMLGSRFDGNGLAVRGLTWVENGVLKQLYYDRFTAKEHDVEPTPWPSAPIMTFTGPTAGSIDELVAQTERAILVTNFWYIRSVDPTDLTLTGMTRDGTFLVEDGKIVCGLRNFRFHDSPLRCFQLINATTAPQEAITLERGKMLLPAVKLPDFHLSSVSPF